MLRKLVFALLGVLMFASVAACGSNSSEPETEALPPNTVLVRGMQFTPASLTVNVGDTVTWKFDDQGAAHNVVSVVENMKDPKVLDSGNPQLSGEYTHTFTEAGTFDYTCTLHPEMLGQVIVEG